jgi:hypothetical protein
MVGGLIKDSCRRRRPHRPPPGAANAAAGATHAACAFFGEAVHEEKALYVEALRAARTSGDMGPWARLMLSFLDRTAAAFRADSMVHALVPFALTRPVFTVRDALDAVGGTFASVNTAATRLVEASRADGQQRGAAGSVVSGGGGAGDIRSV